MRVFGWLNQVTFICIAFSFYLKDFHKCFKAALYSKSSFSAPVMNPKAAFVFVCFNQNRITHFM